jgi:glucose-1-phosphatase
VELSYKKPEEAFETRAENDFYQGFRRPGDMDLSNEQIRDAWNAMLLNFPVERLLWLEEVSTK